MKLNLLNYLLLIFLFSVTVSCSDDSSEAAPVDETPPVITIIAPTDGASIQSGSEVLVEGTIEEESELERVTINISNAFFNDSRTIEKADLPAKEGNIYRLEQSYPVPEYASGTFDIEVIAEDSMGLIGRETFSIMVE